MNNSLFEMEKSRRTTFEYIIIESGARRLFCLQQNLALVIWVLFFQQNTLHPIIRDASQLHSFRFLVFFIPDAKTFVDLKNKITALLRFVVYKYISRREDAVVRLPVFGQTCVQVHKGYKIFDLRKKRLLKFSTKT